MVTNLIDSVPPLWPPMDSSQVLVAPSREVPRIPHGFQLQSCMNCDMQGPLPEAGPVGCWRGGLPPPPRPCWPTSGADVEHTDRWLQLGQQTTDLAIDTEPQSGNKQTVHNKRRQKCGKSKGQQHHLHSISLTLLSLLLSSAELSSLICSDSLSSSN